MRILVIEDEPQLARHIARALSRQDHLVTTEQDGSAGLKAALNHPPEMIVLDLNLPSLDGSSVLAQLRQQRKGSKEKGSYLNNEHCV
jgi:two-component system OmpR family response regulator/two-component system copper resistance phosphate regulon response regulator CusR